jgi:hypothetical protein
MGSKIKKLAPLALLALPFAGPALMGAAGGSGALSGIMGAGAKKFLMNQAITAALSKATTGKIDPKAQLMAGIMSGVGAMGSGASAAEKGLLAKSTSAMNPQSLTNLQAGYAGMSRDAAAALAANQAGTATAAQKALMASRGLTSAPAINAARFASSNPTNFANYLKTAPTLEKLGQTTSNIGRGVSNALYNKPTDLASFAKSAAAYGGPSLAAAAMQTPEVDDSATEKENRQAQAFYDTAANINRAMGGPGGMGMSYEDMNDATGGYLSTMKGTVGNKLTSDDNPAGARYVSMYPNTNYDGLNIFTTDTERFKRRPSAYNPYVMPQYAAEGGMIDPLEEMPIITPMETEEEQRMREAMEQIKMLQAEGFDFSQGNPVPDPYAEAPMTSMNYQGRANGGLMQVASAPDPMAERFDMLENLALDMYKRPLEELQPKEIEVLEGMIDMMDQGMADGGSVPQTNSIPQGMQIDGRGGGFIPMGAKEKHDDVPAMLAKNEFVMTSDAVKAAGGGSVNKGAQVMYDLMNSLESKV